MIILDTDALSHLLKGNSEGLLIEAWLDASPDRETRITVVTAYEMLSGAIALVDRQKKEHRDVIPAFFLFEELVKYLAIWKEKILS